MQKTNFYRPRIVSPLSNFLVCLFKFPVKKTKEKEKVFFFFLLDTKKKLRDSFYLCLKCVWGNLYGYETEDDREKNILVSKGKIICLNHWPEQPFLAFFSFASKRDWKESTDTQKKNLLRFKEREITLVLSQCPFVKLIICYICATFSFKSLSIKLCNFSSALFVHTIIILWWKKLISRNKNFITQFFFLFMCCLWHHTTAYLLN